MHKKTKNLPLPVGKGGGGMGAETKLKAGLTGGKEGKPPLDTGTARSAGDQPGKPPAGDMDGRNCKCRKRFNAGVPGAEPPAK